MKLRILTALTALTALTVTSLVTAFAFAEDTNAIKDAMKYAHKAPKGEKKINEKIIEGTVTDAELSKTLALYIAIGDTKPPKGDAADFKAKVSKLVAATQEVVAKKPDGVASYKEAVNCKACHSEHKAD